MSQHEDDFFCGRFTDCSVQLPTSLGVEELGSSDSSVILLGCYFISFKI